MNCPTCDTQLERLTLLRSNGFGADLRGFECPQDHGTFLPSDLYFDWRDSHKPKQDLDLAVVTDDVGDAKRAKLCPQDGRIMLRYRSGGDRGFWLDRCGTCGGVWFDGSEWDATIAAGLHERLPLVFSDAWERDAEEERAVAARRRRLAETVGADDLARADAFWEWVSSHPHRHLLLARVSEPRTSSA